MFKNKSDILFGFCITFIVVLAIYLGFRQTQQNNLEKYLQILKDKIASMIPEEDQKTLDQFFTDFSDGLNDNSVSTEEVEKLADNIIELRKQKIQLTSEDLKKLLPVIKADSVEKKVTFAFEHLERKDWQELARKFEKSYARCDFIRRQKKNMQKIHERLKDQMDIHARISKELKQNSLRAIKKFEEIKKKELNPQIEKELLEEIERLKQENINIRDKILDLDAMQAYMDKERKMLQKQMQHIDSLRSERL